MNIAEWSSSVARRAHNPKVVGSNPSSATKKPPILGGFSYFYELFRQLQLSAFCHWSLFGLYQHIFMKKQGSCSPVFSYLTDLHFLIDRRNGAVLQKIFHDFRCVCLCGFDCMGIDLGCGGCVCMTKLTCNSGDCYTI